MYIEEYLLRFIIQKYNDCKALVKVSANSKNSNIFKNEKIKIASINNGLTNEMKTVLKTDSEFQQSTLPFLAWNHMINVKMWQAMKRPDNIG